MGADYRLVVEGELGARASSAFEGMKSIHEHGNTAIVGHVRDQAALQGLLQRVADLGLTLLSLTTIDRDANLLGVAVDTRPTQPTDP